ncbi:superoxide dismutase [Altererythrobacter ishigakiensis]|uniref:superoxide dismutase n=1 Tax=Altererythrobacter ishigakiensis TaxID=476157 RepID=A0A562UMJ9_9SPHN|nr:Fe-Mn family superoxide dismutase [Altererythrobacter ishigakiensis]TWJ06806.1 Fe-Mn family superoxide dismutase [Altererythrobacter ishigakiensis]
MSNLTRREAMGTAAVGVAGAALAGAVASEAVAQDQVLAASFAGNHTPKPLRFDPANLTGLSERLITSHWENNYQGSVRGLNTIEKRLAAATADPDHPTVAYSGLKREELHRSGSLVLHELYFAGLGGNGNPGGSIYEALDSWFDNYEAWEAEFRRTAMSLAGGSGWCVLTWNAHTRSLHNYWAWDHMHGAVAGVPLIALDMYEHSYHMDYGTAAARYFDAFMANLDWEVIDARFQAATA